MTSFTPVRYTNLFPTRYAAMEHPGIFWTFRPDAEGISYMGVRLPVTLRRSPPLDAGIWANTERVCYRSTPQLAEEGSRFWVEAWNPPCGRGWFSMEIVRSGFVRFRDDRVATLQDVIRKACDFLQLPPPVWIDTIEAEVERDTAWL